jgi:hypothetical protein
MANATADVTALPAKARGPFQEFARVLSELAGDNLLALSAFGGWLVGDPLYEGSAARSVVVLRRFDLRLLARIAERGVQMGKRGLQAPLIMTPAYIAASCDAFPLELLEIQQLAAVLIGEDHFAALRFDPDNVRLQSEREAKSGLIHLHQGLLSSAGKHRHLDELCRRVAERAVRVLRGVLYMASATMPRRSPEIAARAAEIAGLRFEALGEVLAGGQIRDLERFERFYSDLAALAEYIDGLASGRKSNA